ncbi:MAG: 50S ribosomal protein L29 [Acidobacteriota bacterium]|jgi:large subunit ribosomal protein L29
MSPDELAREERELEKQLFQLRIQKATSQLDNICKIRQVRKDLARVKTVIAEKGAR